MHQREIVYQHKYNGADKKHGVEIEHCRNRGGYNYGNGTYQNVDVRFGFYLRCVVNGNDFGKIELFALAAKRGRRSYIRAQAHKHGKPE